MSPPAPPADLDHLSLEQAFDRLYRAYFHLAERRRRWSLADDIPWQCCNPDVDPAVADVVESFCAVELYLPDYLRTAMDLFRPSRAKTWFYANWGYEESKHSLALGDWLLRSGARTEEQMADLDSQVRARRWEQPHESPVGMLIYAAVQELATGLTYRNLKRHTAVREDVALSRLLRFLGVDEQAHHHFFLQAVRLYLRHDRAATVRQIAQVLDAFTMPAIGDLVDGRQRIAAIKELGVFDPQMFYREVYHPILDALAVTRPELRACR